MKTFVNRINSSKNRNKAFEKGWSFSTMNITGKDSRILFIQ